MIEQNFTEFTKANILKWHNRGYQGKGITWVVLDDGGKPHDFTDVETPIDDHEGIGHKTNVCSVLREVAPEVRIIAFNWFGGRKKATQWIKEHINEIDGVNCSFTSPVELANDLNFLREYDIPIIASSGNHSDGEVGYPSAFNWTISVGAFYAHSERVAPYSNNGEKLDAVAFLELFIGRKVAYKDGKEVNLLYAPIIDKDRAVIGLRDIGNLFDKKVDWDEKQQKITVEG